MITFQKTREKDKENREMRDNNKENNQANKEIVNLKDVRGFKTHGDNGETRENSISNGAS